MKISCLRCRVCSWVDSVDPNRINSKKCDTNFFKSLLEEASKCFQRNFAEFLRTSKSSFLVDFSSESGLIVALKLYPLIGRFFVGEKNSIPTRVKLFQFLWHSSCSVQVCSSTFYISLFLGFHAENRNEFRRCAFIPLQQNPWIQLLKLRRYHSVEYCSIEYCWIPFTE